MVASLSASSSQAFARRITSSRAGSPLGKSVCSSASRLTAPLAAGVSAPLRPLRLRVWLLALGRVVPPLLRLLLLRLRWLEEPDIPWARLRCAPREAARVKVFPHSGQVSTSPPPDPLASSVDAARRALAMIFAGPLEVGVRRQLPR